MKRYMPHTLLIAEILSGKNVRAWVSMDFTQDKFPAPIAIEKIAIAMGAEDLSCVKSRFYRRF